MTEKEGVKGKKETVEYKIPFGRYLIVKSGDKVKKGDPFTDGSFDIKKLFKIAGKESAQNYILNEVGKAYSLQGAFIDDKHIETIIRQMFSRIKIKDDGTTKFNKGEIAASYELEIENEKIKKDGGREAVALPLVLGISEVAINAPSFLSAASFQNTVKVLVKAAINGAEDNFLGLKENVIVGRLIPAGTGFRKEYNEKNKENFENLESNKKEKK